VARVEDITEAALAPVLEQAAGIAIFLIGTGREAWTLPEPLRLLFLKRKLAVELARTGTAVSTYNILLGEGRAVAAGLIAVE
jgi:uncharacterized protein